MCQDFQKLISIYFEFVKQYFLQTFLWVEFNDKTKHVITLQKLLSWEKKIILCVKW